MSEEREINVTDVDKIAELNSYRRLRKAESALTETAINEEVQDCLKNGKSFSNIVECNVQCIDNRKWKREVNRRFKRKNTKFINNRHWS